MANKVHRPLKAIAFNANGISKQRYELRKLLQGLHIDMGLFSETNLKPYERLYIPNYHFYRIDRHPERKGGTAVAVRKGISHIHEDVPPFVSVEATGVCIPIGNREILLAAVYKSPGRTWSDPDITELLSLRHKCILDGDLLQLFDASDFKISAPQCPTHYSTVGNGDVLDIVVHKNIRLSNVIVSVILVSDHLPIIFHILDRIRTKNVSAPLEKITDWERF
jgi:hypothetical protein